MWFEPLLILGLGAAISLGLFIHYQPKINKIKKSYEEYYSKLKDNLANMSESERNEFFSNLPEDTQSYFQDILNDDYSFHGIDQFQLTHHHLQHVEQMHHEQFQDFTQWAMDESIKSVTPFDHGGYVQGPGFNPSDIFAHESMNHHMDMGSSMDMNSGMDTFNHF